MREIARNRLLTGLLLVLLQIGLLPWSSTAGCHMSADEGACCCASVSGPTDPVADPADAPADADCCSQGHGEPIVPDPDPRAPDDSDHPTPHDDRSDPCTCKATPTSPATALAESAEGTTQLDAIAVSFARPGYVPRADDLSVQRLLPQCVPRPDRGPPLQLLHLVFLI